MNSLHEIDLTYVHTITKKPSPQVKNVQCHTAHTQSLVFLHIVPCRYLGRLEELLVWHKRIAWIVCVDLY